jgi:hypothetical protein
MNARPARYVLCVRADTDLIPRKLYRRVADRKAEEIGWVRVVDESDEEYLHRRDRFAEVLLPASVERLLARAGARRKSATPAARQTRRRAR